MPTGSASVKETPAAVTIAGSPRNRGEDERDAEPRWPATQPRKKHPNQIRTSPMRQTLMALSLLAVSVVAVSPASAQAPKKGGKVGAALKAKAEALFDKIDKDDDGKI